MKSPAKFRIILVYPPEGFEFVQLAALLVNFNTLGSKLSADQFKSIS